MVLGRQWLLLPGPALEAIPGLGVLPFWLLVVGAIAVLGRIWRMVPAYSFGWTHPIAGILPAKRFAGINDAFALFLRAAYKDHCVPMRIEAGWPGSLKRLPVSVIFVPSTFRMDIS